MSQRETDLTQFIKPPKANRKAKKAATTSTSASAPVFATPSSNTAIPSSTSKSETLDLQGWAFPKRFAPPVHALTHYGNTLAIIQDSYRDKDGYIKTYSTLPIPQVDMMAGKGHTAWLQEKQRRVENYSRRFEIDDYRLESPATCQPARVALSKYLKFPKLFGERKYARGYQLYRPTRVSTKHLGFLNLPGEIRNTIYEYCLVSEEPFELLPKSSTQYKKRPFRALNVCEQDYQKRTAIARRLFRVSKVVNEESSGVFYGSNEFRFTGEHGWTWLAGFMNFIGPRNAAQLRQISVHIHWPGKTLDISDFWYANARDGRLIQECIDSFGPKAFPPLDKYRTPTEAYNECMKTFHDAGVLQELNRILPYCYDVQNAWDLNLDTTKFKHPVAVKLIHLDTNGQKHIDDAEYHSSHRPLRKKTTPGKTSKGQKAAGPKLIQEFNTPKVYAKAKGWGYEKIQCGSLGQFSAREPRDEDLDDEDGESEAS